MLKVGDYKTKGGYAAHVVFVGKDRNGAGYISMEVQTLTSAWFANGVRHGSTIDHYNLVLSPPTITIPETTLPEPMREPPEVDQQVYMTGLAARTWSAFPAIWENRDICSSYLASGMCHHTREAAQQWADFLNKYAAGKP